MDYEEEIRHLNQRIDGLEQASGQPSPLSVDWRAKAHGWQVAAEQCRTDRDDLIRRLEATSNERNRLQNHRDALAKRVEPLEADLTAMTHDRNAWKRTAEVAQSTVDEQKKRLAARAVTHIEVAQVKRNTELLEGRTKEAFDTIETLVSKLQNARHDANEALTALEDIESGIVDQILWGRDGAA